MNLILMTFISIICGAAIALQSTLSGQLNGVVNNSLFTSFAIYIACALLMVIVFFISGTEIPAVSILKKVPRHLWVFGAILSVFALSTIYWLMPKIGVARVMTGVLLGQLLTSVIVSHFGFFGLPELKISFIKLVGIVFIFVGIVMVNWRVKSGL